MIFVPIMFNWLVLPWVMHKVWLSFFLSSPNTSIIGRVLESTRVRRMIRLKCLRQRLLSETSLREPLFLCRLGVSLVNVDRTGTLAGILLSGACVPKYQIGETPAGLRKAETRKGDYRRPRPCSSRRITNCRQQSQIWR